VRRYPFTKKACLVHIKDRFTRAVAYLNGGFQEFQEIPGLPLYLH
jgi:hypothetical protein